MTKFSIQVAVNDEASEPFEAEHGLSLVLRVDGALWLFDTGAGQTTLPNLDRLGVDRPAIRRVFLSHGHYDHTGGIDALLRSGAAPEFWHAPGLDALRYKIGPDKSAKAISIPETCRVALAAVPAERRHQIERFSELTQNAALTGPIPRSSFETTGGAFFFDPEGKTPDPICDEQSLVLSFGGASGGGEYLLVTGCCHAGIVNTLEHCRRNGRPIHTIVGGLHLNAASDERLARTADFLNRSTVRRLVLLHCTGSGAAEFLKSAFRGETVTAACGDRFLFEE